MMFRIVRYDATHHDEWNRSVAKARNATFLFYREYMDYHSDRFKDHSLLFYVGNHLHSVLLSVPDMVHEEQVLQHLQDLQLGLRNDVHASVFCQKNIYVESFGAVRCIAVPLGNHILPAPGAVLRENE